MDGVQRMSNTEGHSLYVQVRPMQFHIKDVKMEAEEGDSSVVTQAGCVVTVTSDERRRARAAASVVSLLAIVHVVLIYSTVRLQPAASSLQLECCYNCLLHLGTLLLFTLPRSFPC